MQLRSWCVATLSFRASRAAIHLFACVVHKSLVACWLFYANSLYKNTIVSSTSKLDSILTVVPADCVHWLAMC